VFLTRWFLHRALRACMSVIKVVSPIIVLTFLWSCASVPEIDQSLLNSAVHGNVPAQYEIGMTYYEARYAFWGGKAAYWEDAARWFEMAASQGDPRAQYRLSAYYFNVQQDYDQSFRLLRSPAEQGIAEAQYEFGIHYAQAWGTPQDLVLAYKWIALAHEGGIPNSGKLGDVNWLVYKGKLSDDQISEGQRLAAEHTAAYGKSRSIQLIE
jgi:TPR repeat protein